MSSLVYNVIRQKPELITPAEPTPYEVKSLSDIDDQQSFRIHSPGIQSYRTAPVGRDPAKVIKEAVSKALVHYYPLAGRLREQEGEKLVVECNGEGTLFIEADADVTLDEFDVALRPPFPCTGELLHDVPGLDGVLDSPLLFIQVTRLKCGGFIFAHRINHAVMDGAGLSQFMHAVGELARGAQFPSIMPVWERHLLSARNPPQVTFRHREYDQIPCLPFDFETVHTSFFFGPTEMAAIRRFLPAHLKSSSTFEVLTAFIWRSRTKALQFKHDDEVRARIMVNARHKFTPALPAGYYGNVIASPHAISTAGNLARNPIGYALELIREAKNSVTHEYIQSLADFIVLNDRPMFATRNTFTVSDVSRLRLDKFDFGWGPPTQGGPAKGYVGGALPGHGSFYLSAKNFKRESGILVPMDLPRPAMERFKLELSGYLSDALVLEQPISSPRSCLKNGSSLAMLKGSTQVYV